MDLATLKYFYAVATDKSFSKAARRLNAQQPNLSRAVRLLEDDLGVKLFDRNTRTVILTGAGVRLFGECQKLFDMMEGLPNFVRQEESEFQGYLQFGISDSMSHNVLPAVLQKFQRQHPKVISSVVMGPAKSMFQKLESGDLEFALLFTESPSGLDLESKPFLKIPFHVVASAKALNNPQALQSFIAAREIEEGRLDDFKEWPLIKSLVPGIKIQFSANNYMLHKELVIQGAGVSLFPSYLVAEEVRKKQLVILNKKRPLEFKLQLITRRQRSLSPRAVAFLELLKEQLQMLQRPQSP